MNEQNFMHNQQTKKQLRQSGAASSIISLILALGAIGFVYWDYREQIKFYNFWERGSGLDFKTGKMIPNYQPPPFKYRYDRMTFLPYIIIIGSVSLLMLLMAASELRKSSKMSETPEMIRADAGREAYENSPEVKNRFRQNLIIRFLPFVLLIPVPFIAVYGLGAIVFAVYIFFVAIAVGASYFVVPRLMNKR